ncbi:nickel-responsive transcriptional regulator NikR [Pontibaca salina]|uniref:Putative nickel-responsive regulator n=1 Tax=Pontibaca salina TaxID=2795731 RepID=A0A934HSX5_9RHOB|nr:nickel-responsive transcriptional regulator NikR [Pontibaca salina]MBI6629940.1 nickel-responsive transcriptional regulator NikR [Pontibaca salina]
MQRITISLEEDLLNAVDAMCEDEGYTSRSEAMRDILRAAIQATTAPKRKVPQDGQTCFAALSYVYDHQTRDLARKLTDNQHNHHTLTVATMHIHVDLESCLEVAILKGMQAEVEHFAQGIMTQRGVRHGQLNIIPQS